MQWGKEASVFQNLGGAAKGSDGEDNPYKRRRTVPARYREGTGGPEGERSDREMSHSNLLALAEVSASGS